jgi:DNA-binding response OmpR family regulator
MGAEARLRVLVVEDDPDCAEITALLLGAWGHDAEVARDGAGALEAARRGPPDVVLLDLGLPDMSGLEVARRLREQRPASPPLLVAVTGLGRESDRLASRRAGAHLHLVKPVEPAELRGLLERVRAFAARGVLS